MRRGKIKGRSATTYQKKVDKIKKWYRQRELCRKAHTELVSSLKDKKDPTKKDLRIINKVYNELKSLDWYLEKIKKTTSK